MALLVISWKAIRWTGTLGLRTSNPRCMALAAISISVPLQRMPADRIDSFGRKIVGAAREISLKLGAPGDDRRNVNDPGSADDR